MNNDKKTLANPFVVLREEFDDWAVLFDSDSGHGFGLNPTGVYVWKLLDGEHSIDDVLEALSRDAKDVSREADEQIASFIDVLTDSGLAAHEEELGHNTRGHAQSCSTQVPKAVKFGYEPPQLVDLSGRQAAYGANCNTTGSQATTCNTTGHLANNMSSANCMCGGSPTNTCVNGQAAKGINPQTCNAGTGRICPDCPMFGGNACSCSGGTVACL